MITLVPPMELGQTLDGKDPDGNLTNEDKLGMCHTFQNVTLTGGPNRSKTPKSGRAVTAVLLRNTSALTLLGKRLGQLDRTAGYAMVKNVDGYSAGVVGSKGVVLIDPNLPTGGVADDDIFWGIISGPALCLLPLVAADHTLDIALNDPLVSATGTTSGVTTSGRITHVRFTNATSGESGAGLNAFNMIYGCVGRAMSARTSQETTAGADLLVDFAIHLFGVNR
jgi:hypothetical protein